MVLCRSGKFKGDNMFIEKDEYTNEDFKSYLRAYTYGKEIDKKSENEQNTINLFVSILENLDSKVAKILNKKLDLKEVAFNELLNEKVIISFENEIVHVDLRPVGERLFSACKTFNNELQGITANYNEDKIINILGC